MEDNRILYSDVSYVPEKKIAAVSVYDVTDDSYEKAIYKNVKNNFIGEGMALKQSIMLAIKKGYKNVVFIYDSKNIDIETLKKEFSPFFEVMQFLWLKREFLKKVDSCAKKTLRECLLSEKNDSQENDLNLTKDKKQAEQIINQKEDLNLTKDSEQAKKSFNLKKLKELREQAETVITKYFLEHILNKNEVSILKNIMFNGKNKVKIDKKDSLLGLRALYSMLSDVDNARAFYLKIKSNYLAPEKIRTFGLKMSNKELITLMNKRKR